MPKKAPRYRVNGTFNSVIGTVLVRSAILNMTYEVDVPAPVGRRWANLALEMLELANSFQGIRGTDADDDTAVSQAIFAAIKAMIGEDAFWDKYMPAAFGVLGQDEDTEFFQENFTIMELMNPFFEAVTLIANASFGTPEAEEAVGKLPEGEAIIEGEKVP